jgi:hypothetical protein
MKTALEEELGTAFRARVTTLPPEASTRIRSVDYRPRQHGRVLPVGLGAGAAAGAATAGTVLAVVLGGAAPAYAGWSAIPASSTASVTDVPSCVSSLTNAPAGSSGTGSATGSGSGTWQTLLSDVRGPFTITLLQNGTSYATCFTSPSFTEVNRIDSSAGGSSGGGQTNVLNVNQGTDAGGSAPQGGVGSLVRIDTTSSGDLTQVLQNHLTTASDGPYTFIDGRVANGVTGVTLVLSDGTDVVSTVADGWFVAWWPGDTADATSAQVTKASGTTSETLVPVSGTGLKAGPGHPSSGTPLPGSGNSGNFGATGTTGVTGGTGAGPGSRTK